MKRTKFSLRLKMIFVVLAVALVIASAAILVSYSIYANTMDTHYQTLTMNLAKTTASMLDKDEVSALTGQVMDIYRQSCEEDGTAPDFDSFSEEDWDRYYDSFSPAIQTEEYAHIMSILSKIREDNDIQSLYLCYMDAQTGKAVYILDASDPGNACLPGDCDDIEAGNMELMEQGIYDFPAYITNYEEYGWLCSAAAGVTDGNGHIIVNSYVDISMNDVMQDRYEFLARLLVVLTLAALILIVLLVIAIGRSVVRPINKLAAAAEAFVSEKEGRGASGSAISRLEIHTGDEIENLSYSIKNMEQDINNYISDLTRVTAEKERIGAELSSMLPCIFPAFPEREEFDIYANMHPAKEVGGDFYDFFLVDSDHLALVIADVSGKGVPAALFMVIAKTLIKNEALTGKQPQEVLAAVNNQLCENNDAEMFVTAWLGIYEISTGRMVCSNAGHEFPAIKRADGSFELYKDRHGFVLAGMEGSRYRPYELKLAPGDVLFVYTDGVAEATDAANELYGTDRMLNALNGASEAKPEALLEAVKADIDRFVGEAPQFDDITMLCLQVKSLDLDTTVRMDSLTVPAELDQLDTVQEFIGEHLSAAGCPPKVEIAVQVAVEELYVNIAHYAYTPGTGNATIRCGVGGDPKTVTIQFEDSGVPFDPLAKKDADTTLSADEREIGGLGILMVKKSMDQMAYERRDGKNILTIQKKLP